MARWPVVLCLLPALAGQPACAGAGDGDEEDLEAVSVSKADDYYSTVSKEFEVAGSVRVTLDPAQAADETYRNGKIEARLTGVSLFLTAFLTNKLERFFKNLEYGGFSAMARNHTIAPGDVTEVSPGVLDVRFSIDVAGPKDLIQRMPLIQGGDPGIFAFELALPEGYEATADWIDRSQIRNFDPKTYSGAVERLICTIAPEPTPDDAWPDFAGMMGDGVFDVTLFYGHDYNTPRSDLSEAEAAFAGLQDMGFTAPVAAFADLKADSGAFVRTIRAGGKDVRVEVRIFHSDLFQADRKAGHDTALAELAARDVFFYNGHAGPFYGFYLSDASQWDVKYQEIVQASLPEKQQFFVAQGCQTYSQYADVLFANAAKSEANLDVITTVNFSYGQGTMGILQNLLALDDRGNHRPRTFNRIISDLNEDYWNSMKDVFYGVHGIEKNPRIHPWAALDKVGSRCKKRTDCGDSDGNVCVRPGLLKSKVCGAVALEKAECPAGTTLSAVASSQTIVGHACLP